MITQDRLNAEAKRVSKLLQERDLKIVLAESCTGGLVSATLTRIPGISTYLCGSAVVYQEATKTGWLGVPRKMLAEHGPVSRVVAVEMARRVLVRTPHADLSAAITGHLGPGAPKRLDGVVFVAAARRTSGGKRARPQVVVKRLRLQAETEVPSRRTNRPLRLRRQREAAHAVLVFLRTKFENTHF